MSRKFGPPTSEDVQKNAERTYKHFQPNEVMRRLGIGVTPTYFYVHGFTPEGKPICYGPVPKEEAEALGRGLIEGEVFELNTSNFAKAKSEIKAELMRRGVPPDNALRRMYRES